MKHFSLLLLLMNLLLVSCELKLKPTATDGQTSDIKIERYDRLQSRYLTTGDFSALQEMNTEYPIETRTLIEKVLNLGSVEDYEINSKFLKFFQDSTLQLLIAEAEAEYMRMDDLEEEMTHAFKHLNKWFPDLKLPYVYAQIGALDQSIIVGENSIGISLDKYMGTDYPLYQKYYSEEQRESMTRRHIVPEAMSFYLLSHYPLSDYDFRSQNERDLHMGKIMWIVNKAVGRNVFNTKFVTLVEKYMKRNPRMEISQMLLEDNYSALQP